MPRQDEQYRDERGRYASDDDRYSRSGFSGRPGDHRGNGPGYSRSNDRERDEQGRFMSDDDRGYSRGNDRGERGRSMSDGDRGRGSQWSSERGDHRSEFEGNSGYSPRERGDGRGGWSSGAYEPSDRSDRGWDDRSGSNDYRGPRARDNKDYRGRSRGGHDDEWSRGRAVEFGGSERYSEWSGDGWEDRSSSPRPGWNDEYRGRSAQGRDDGADDRGRSRGGRDDDDRGRGWFGDPRGHAEAARRGWEGREDADSRGQARSSDHDDDRGRSRGGRDDQGGQGGWFGDPRGHAQAARRGWEHRR